MAALRSLKANPNGVTQIQKALTTKRWGHEDLAEKADLSRSTAINFCTAIPVDRKNFVIFCELLELDWQIISGDSANVRSETSRPIDTDRSSSPPEPNCTSISDFSSEVSLASLWNVPNSPPHFLSRPKELDDLKTKLLNVDVPITFWGMPGLGKSVLAAEIARDLSVQQAFPDGIFWLTVGQEGKLLDLQTSLAAALMAGSDRQPEFTTVQQGQMQLRSLLQDKACLLVLDDIWNVSDLDALNGVGVRGQLLVTTRDARITTGIGATEYRLELLERPQARQLLAEWTNLEETDLPPESDAVLEECGALPLALAMVGAMLRRHPDRWENVLNKLRSADLEKIQQQFPHYPYPNLFKTIQVSVDALEPDLRMRYLDLAVFPEDVAIPERVLQIWWASTGLDEYEVQDVIDELADLSLLRKDEQGRITLHDLQMDFVRKRSEQRLPQLHQGWIAAYRVHCPKGWHGLVNDGYCFEGLPSHLKQAGKQEELRSLLFDFRWLQVRLRETAINGLLSDYDLLSEDQTLVLVRNSLRLSAHVLVKEKAQLAGRILGHLLGREQPEIQALLMQAQQPQPFSWVRPLHANLTPPDGALLRTLEEGGGAQSVVALPDGKRALSTTSFGSLQLWDIEKGKVLKLLEGHVPGIQSVVVLLPDGKRALSTENDGMICSKYKLKLWDIEQGVLLKTLEGHSDRVVSVAVLPDGKRALSASYDKTLKLWNLEQGIAIRTLEGHSDFVSSVAVVLPDGKYALSASDCTLKLWDIEQGVLLKTLEGHSLYVHSVAVLPDGKRALSASGDGIKLWSLEQCMMSQILEGHSGPVSSVAVLPDGKRVLSASYDKTLKLWDIQQGTVLKTLNGHSNGVSSMAMLPDGKSALSAEVGGTLMLWDLDQGVILKTLEGHDKLVRSLSVLPDGKHVLSASDDKTLKLWDLEQGVLLKTLEGYSDRFGCLGVGSVAVLPDGKRALSASLDKTLKLWDLDQGVVIKTLDGDIDVSSVAVLPDGKRALSGSYDRTLKLWDLDQGVVLKTLEGHFVNSMVVLPDGDHLLSASFDKSLMLWDLSTDRLVANLNGDSLFYCCAVAPDGVTIVVGDSAGRVHFLKIESASRKE
jgi:WD40 repeat protein